MNPLGENVRQERVAREERVWLDLPIMEPITFIYPPNEIDSVYVAVKKPSGAADRNSQAGHGWHGTGIMAGVTD